MADRVCVAQIGAPHGVRGEVRFRIFTEDPMAITHYGPLEIAGRDAAIRDRVAATGKEIIGRAPARASTTAQPRSG